MEGPHAEALTRIVLLKKLYPNNLMACAGLCFFFCLRGDENHHVTMATNQPSSLLCSKHFDFKYFNSLDAKGQAGLLQCCRSGIENPDSGMGLYAMQPADYDTYKPYFRNVLAAYHRVSPDAKHVNNWSLAGVEGLPADGAHGPDRRPAGVAGGWAPSVASPGNQATLTTTAMLPCCCVQASSTWPSWACPRCRCACAWAATWPPSRCPAP